MDTHQRLEQEMENRFFKAMGIKPGYGSTEQSDCEKLAAIATSLALRFARDSIRSAEKDITAFCRDLDLGADGNIRYHKGLLRARGFLSDRLAALGEPEKTDSAQWQEGCTCEWGGGENVFNYPMQSDPNCPIESHRKLAEPHGGSPL